MPRQTSAELAQAALINKLDLALENLRILHQKKIDAYDVVDRLSVATLELKKLSESNLSDYCFHYAAYEAVFELARIAGQQPVNEEPQTAILLGLLNASLWQAMSAVLMCEPDKALANLPQIAWGYQNKDEESTSGIDFLTVTTVPHDIFSVRINLFQAKRAETGKSYNILKADRDCFKSTNMSTEVIKKIQNEIEKEKKKLTIFEFLVADNHINKTRNWFDLKREFQNKNRIKTEGEIISLGEIERFEEGSDILYYNKIPCKQHDLFFRMYIKGQSLRPDDESPDKSNTPWCHYVQWSYDSSPQVRLPLSVDFHEVLYTIRYKKNNKFKFPINLEDKGSLPLSYDFGTLLARAISPSGGKYNGLEIHKDDLPEFVTTVSKMVPSLMLLASAKNEEELLELKFRLRDQINLCVNVTNEQNHTEHSHNTKKIFDEYLTDKPSFSGN